MTSKKKILIPIFNRAHYGRLRSVLSAVKNHPNLELQIITSSPLAYGSFFLNLYHSNSSYRIKAFKWYLRARWISFIDKIIPGYVEKSDFIMSEMKKNGYSIEQYVPMHVDGGTNISMCKTVGIGIIKLVDVYSKLRPDIVLINGDRFEIMSAALVSSYLNIPIAHIEGGDVSGTIDESTRHAITKLAHLHFTPTALSRRRVVQMGENQENVFVVGAPTIDNIKQLDVGKIPDYIVNIKKDKKFLLVLFHPVTTESAEKNLQLAKSIISAVEELALPTVFLGSNIDARSREVGQEIKKLIAKKYKFIFATKNLPPDDFYRLLANASCVMGNSSSFIKETCYFGIPAVLVGSRQQLREKGENVKEVKVDKDEVIKAIKEQLKHGKYERDCKFGDGQAGERIAEILAKKIPEIQKRFFDINFDINTK